jgi:hypothetical protein
MSPNERRHDDPGESHTSGAPLLFFRVNDHERRVEKLEARADAFTEHLNTTNTRLAVLVARLTAWAAFVSWIVNYFIYRK